MAYVPFALTRAAQNAWKDVKGRSSKNKVGAWTLAGPSTDNFPAVLTFSGAAYTTSGRVTALVIDPACSQARCTVWMGAAGGGVWRTDKRALRQRRVVDVRLGQLRHERDRHAHVRRGGGDALRGNRRAQRVGDSEAGFGIYKSTDRGATWTKLAANTSVPTGAGVDCDAVFGAPPGTFGVQHAPAYSGPAFDGRSIGSIVVDPDNTNVLYVASARGVRGVSSVTGGAVSLAPGLPPYGLWKSTDGGASFTLLNYQDVCLNPTLPGSAGIIQASFGSTRGVHEAALDPGSPSIVYAAAFPQNNAIPLNTKGGVWRSTDAGASWMQIKNALNPAQNTDRASFAVAAIAGGLTRMYVGVGNSSIGACATCDGGSNQARVYRTDDAVTATNASFTDLTASSRRRRRRTRRSTTAATPRSAAPSAGTTTSSSRLPASPTSSTSAAPTATASTASGTTAGRSSVPRMRASRSPT
jgi:hypothetical protein